MWVNSCRYLGIYFTSSRTFTCSFEHSKTKFYKAFNAIFGKIGRMASEEVIIHLLTTKCVPILLYGLEACPVKTRDKKSLDFSINRIFMKLFRTGSITIVEQCQALFGFIPVSYSLDLRKLAFLEKFCNSTNEICSQLAADARADILMLCNAYSVTNYPALKRKIDITLRNCLL